MQLLYSTSALVRNVGLSVIIKGKLIMAIQIKGMMDQYFPVGPFIIMFTVVLTFFSADGNAKGDQ